MAQLFESGFESGDFTGWSTSGSPTIETASPYEGTYFARLYSATAYNVLTCSTSFTTARAYGRFYVRFTDKFGEVWNLYPHFVLVGDLDVGFYSTTGNGSESTMTLRSNMTDRGSTSGTFGLDQWYFAQLQAYAADANSIAELKMGGETITSTANFGGTINVTGFIMWGGAWNYYPEGQEYDAFLFDDASYPGEYVSDDYFLIYHRKPNVLLRR